MKYVMTVKAYGKADFFKAFDAASLDAAKDMVFRETMSAMKGVSESDHEYDGWYKFPFSPEDIVADDSGALRGEAEVTTVTEVYYDGEGGYTDSWEATVVEVTAVPSMSSVPWDEFDKEDNGDF